MDDKIKQFFKLAEDILKLSRNTLIVNLRFMDLAMSRLNIQPYDGTVATDGRYIYYNPVHVLQSYKQAKELPTRAFLHMVMHCVFQHFFVDLEYVEHDLWDLACDMAVEAVICELGLESTTLIGDSISVAELANIQANSKFLTAECIYSYLINSTLSQEEIDRLSALFKFDDHSIWYDLGGGGYSISGSGQSDVDSGIQESNEDELDRQTREELFDELRKDWKNISESMQTEMETFAKKRGKEAGYLVQNLKAVNREKYDYSSFLKKFAVMGEAMKVNDDEFDYIFYTYGMQLFDREMPLIEPLEYKDVKRIKEFVIAIDTSGSVSGELVQKFLNKTYNIMKQQENYFTKINVHIIQCDTRVVDDAKITCQEDFDKYIATLELKGFGGTDFRPVFQYVDELIEKKEFTNLKGLIYFTDGCGTFPKLQPKYHTAFVFIDDEYNNYQVPVWAIKLILRSEEI